MKRSKNKFLQFIFSFLVLLTILTGCKKDKTYDGHNSLETVKYNSNSTTYSPIEVDSIQARNYITQLKLQELYDLATNYSSGNRDTEIDLILHKQIEEYFLKKDSSTINKFIKNLDSLQVKFIKVNNVKTFKGIQAKDTIDLASYNLDYFNKDKKFLKTDQKEVQYILKDVPVKESKFKREFKFYFINFNPNYKKDSISSGVTK